MNEYRKVVIIGDGGVGKSSIRTRYIHDRFSKSYKATIGADFVTKKVQVHNKQIALQIWDTAGQERFQSLSSAYYRGSDCCVLVYDVTEPNSLHSIASWIKDFIIQSKVEDIHQFLFVLVGNKADSTDRLLSFQQGQKASVILKELIDELANEKKIVTSVVPAPKFSFRSKPKEGDNELVNMEKSLASVTLRPLKNAISRDHIGMPNRDSMVSFYTAQSEFDDSLIEDQGIPFFETSALEGSNIDALFEFIATQSERISNTSTATITLSGIEEPTKNTCFC
jgi:Ras-related protein Rab-7A